MKFLASSALLILSVGSAFAQTPPIDGVFEKTNVISSKVTSYPYLREADVMWTKRVWREIDLREKMNQPLNHPQARLSDILMNAVIAGELTAYSPVANARNNDNGDEFKVPMTAEAVASIGGGSDTIPVVDPNTGATTYQVYSKEFNRDDIVKYRLKEDWIFDKQRGEFQPRIIGIAPIYKLRNTGGEVVDETPMFWVYFPEARNVLVNAEVFNRANDAAQLSFDDVFVKRLFNSYITKMSNAQDNRIEDYSQGIDALYEAQRLKEYLINYEHDLWEY